MTKKIIFNLVLFSSITILSSGFKPFNSKLFTWFHVHETKKIVYTPQARLEVNQKSFNIPFTGKTFIGFQENLAARESLCIYSKVNTLGYLGKYQFGAETLKLLGIRDLNSFLANRDMQDKAFKANLARNKWDLQPEILKYSGKIIKGVEITESGILAAAHLGGTGSVKKFLKTKGVRNFKDGYGTSIRDYFKDFAGYNTSNIEPSEFPKAKNY
jgi:hypothetical protein